MDLITLKSVIKVSSGGRGSKKLRKTFDAGTLLMLVSARARTPARELMVHTNYTSFLPDVYLRASPGWRTRRVKKYDSEKKQPLSLWPATAETPFSPTRGARRRLTCRRPVLFKQIMHNLIMLLIIFVLRNRDFFQLLEKK